MKFIVSFGNWVRRFLSGFTRILLCSSIVVGCSSGATTDLIVDAGAGSAEPHLAVGADGTTILSFLEPNARGVDLRYSVLGDNGWAQTKTVASGSNWFVNWADFPSIEPLTETRWAAHWLVKMDGGKYAYNAVVSVSEDAGVSWSEPTLLHSDATATEHGFVSLYASGGGVGAVWLDGRQMANSGGGMQLRTAVLENDVLVQAGVIDTLVCDCCQTDVAIAASGPIAVYRNRSADEIRDIYVAREVEGVWQVGVPVAADGWLIEGCPVNGPAIATNNSTVAVAWYTEAPVKVGKSNRVQLVMSNDSGQSFGEPIEMGAIDPIGRVDVVVLADGGAAVSWVERGVGELMVQRVAESAVLSAPQLVTAMETNRGAGFPQMVAAAGGLVFAWTDTRDAASRVRSLRVEL